MPLYARHISVLDTSRKNPNPSIGEVIASLTLSTPGLTCLANLPTVAGFFLRRSCPAPGTLIAIEGRSSVKVDRKKETPYRLISSRSKAVLIYHSRRRLVDAPLPYAICSIMALPIFQAPLPQAALAAIGIFGALVIDSGRNPVGDTIVIRDPKPCKNSTPKSAPVAKTRIAFANADDLLSHVETGFIISDPKAINSRLSSSVKAIFFRGESSTI